MANKTHDINEIIHELTDSETLHLQKLFQDPVVVKYFKNVAYNAVLEQAMYPVDELASKAGDVEFLVKMAYQKGILATAELILNNTPIKE